MNIIYQLIWLFILPIPIASISWTVTHEEVFREPREYCIKKCKTSISLLTRKFFYLFTCEYCFSHYVTVFFLWLTNYKLLIANWAGYLIAAFSIIWIANIYMSLFALIRQKIKLEKTEIDIISTLHCDYKQKN